MSTTNTNVIFHDDHVAGGWTEHDTITRRICTALWKCTETFERIENYHSDIVLDYQSLLYAVTLLEPGCSFSFVYSVGNYGTHLAINHAGREINNYESHVKGVLDYDSGPATAKFAGTVTRSEFSTDEYGHRWGADRYGLTVEALLS